MTSSPKSPCRAGRFCAAWAPRWRCRCSTRWCPPRPPLAKTAGQARAPARLRLHADGLRHHAAGRRRATSSTSFRRSSVRSRRCGSTSRVITNLELQNAYPGSHATSNAAFLSAAKAKLTESTDYYLGTTVDQIAAQQIGQETQLPSLELSMDLLQVVGQCDNGYACVYQNNLSWSSPTTPLPAEAHPRIVFESLFGEGGSIAERRAALRKRASLLDSVNDDHRPPATQARSRRSREGQPVPRDRARSGAPHSEGRGRRGGESAAGSRSAGRRARRLRRSRAADVRSAGAGAAGRRHARHHVPARARDEQSHLSRRSACPIRITRFRITATIRRRSRAWRRSMRSTSRSSRSSSRS